LTFFFRYVMMTSFAARHTELYKLRRMSRPKV